MNVIDVKQDNVFGKVYKFEESLMSPYGINGQYFLDFTKYIRVTDFEELDFEICYGLSRLNLDKIPMVSGPVPKNDQLFPQLVGHYESEAKYYYDDDSKKLQDLSDMEIRKFLYYRKKSILPWYFVLDLKPNIFNTKSRDLYPWDKKIEMFPKLKECILSMPFSEIGRVVIYGSWSESTVPCHRDSVPNRQCDNHINFNPGGYRPVYIYDPLSKEKIYLPKTFKFYGYNTTDYHGVDALPHFSYTVRVDGVFNHSINCIL